MTARRLIWRLPPWSFFKRQPRRRETTNGPVQISTSSRPSSWRASSRTSCCHCARCSCATSYSSISNFEFRISNLPSTHLLGLVLSFSVSFVIVAACPEGPTPNVEFSGERGSKPAIPNPIAASRPATRTIRGQPTPRPDTPFLAPSNSKFEIRNFEGVPGGN